ncbi:MAG: YbaK/EbsC family protein [Candidatus Adiutrix sp.]|jgi:prolyl-tRNA editing enzyme YbaK/EbsC (Cys-tRNA(Pro) deacylase)|nr:YbaK/EbsC family protein [Candidatus Adiutrix sp.]
MSTEKVKQYLAKWQRDQDVVELAVSTATVNLAAEALGVIPGRIAKSITFYKADSGLMVVAAGDTRIDNKKFKKCFGFSPKMLSMDEARRLTGFEVGGICPFDLPDTCEVYLDESLKRFESIFPACGSSSSMIELTVSELEEYSRSRGWVDVCRQSGQN